MHSLSKQSLWHRCLVGVTLRKILSIRSALFCTLLKPIDAVTIEIDISLFFLDHMSSVNHFITIAHHRVPGTPSARPGLISIHWYVVVWFVVKQVVFVVKYYLCHRIIASCLVISLILQPLCPSLELTRERVCSIACLVAHQYTLCIVCCNNEHGKDVHATKTRDLLTSTMTRAFLGHSQILR